MHDKLFLGLRIFFQKVVDPGTEFIQSNFNENGPTMNVFEMNIPLFPYLGHKTEPRVHNWVEANGGIKI